jgi:hypothetical protein
VRRSRRKPVTWQSSRQHICTLTVA